MSTRIAIAVAASGLILAGSVPVLADVSPAPPRREAVRRKATKPVAHRPLPKRVYYPRAVRAGRFSEAADVMPWNGPYCRGSYCGYGYPAYGYVYGSPSNAGPTYPDGCGFVWRQVWIPSWGWSVRRRWECDGF